MQVTRSPVQVCCRVSTEEFVILQYQVGTSMHFALACTVRQFACRDEQTSAAA